MKSALLLIVVCGVLVWGCSAIDWDGLGITEPPPVEVMVDPDTGEHVAVQRVETAEEFGEKMAPVVKTAAKTIVDAAASTGWGQAAQGVAAALGGLITTGAGVYWGIKRRKKTKRDKRAGDTVVKAVEHVRQVNPAVKVALSRAITLALENTGLTREEYNAYIAEKKPPKAPMGD